MKSNIEKYFSTFTAMLNKISLKLLVGIAVFLVILLLGTGFLIGKNSKKQEGTKQKPAQEASISDALLLNKNLKSVLNVHRETTLKVSKDTLSASEIWYVPNGMSIPNYMLIASRKIERCKGKIHWMKEIREGRAALLKYEGEQGVYPLTEVRIVDSLWLPNSSKLAVVLAVREQNKILKNNPQILESLNFKYNLLIPSSRRELLEEGKKLNANIIPWIPMESSEKMYSLEKRNQISIGIADERELEHMLEGILKNFDNTKGFASLYGEDFLVHAASIEKFIDVLASKNLWFWDLTKRGTASLTLMKCSERDLRCRKDYLDAESEAQITKALRAARLNGRAILLFDLTEKSIELLKNLPSTAERQGTNLVYADDVF